MSDFLKYENVAVSQSAVWESKDGRVVEQYERDQVVDCALERGSPEQRPEISAALGGVLAVPGLVFARHMYIFATEGRAANIRYEAAMLAIGLIGAWLVVQALLSRRYFLRVRVARSTRKLLFSKAATRGEIETFLESARTKYGFDARNLLS